MLITLCILRFWTDAEPQDAKPMHHHNQAVALLSARDQTLNIFRDVQHLVFVPALTRSAEDRTVPGWKRHLGQRPSRA